MSSPNRITTRVVPGTKLRTSSVGVRVEPARLGAPGLDPRMAPHIGRIREAGITTFEVGGGAGAARVERLLGSALSRADSEVVILGHRSLSSLADEAAHVRGERTAPDLVSRLRSSLAASRSRLAPHRIDLLVWDLSAEAAPDSAEVYPALEQLREQGEIAGWVSRVAPGLAWPVLPTSGPHLYEAQLSPLDRELLPELSSRASSEVFGVFADDPLGGGRLDGTRIPGGLMDRGPTDPPARVSELEREFAPVLRLEFLTARSGRTLAQSAIRFALHWPWVCSVLVPLPRPEQLAEVAAADRAPPLTDEEVRRILDLPP